MDIQLQELLDRIKREGVDEAERRAAEILGKAEENRKAILAEAERDAKAIRSEAKAAAAREEEAGRAALARASRDLVLAFRDKITAVLSAAVRNDVASAYDAGIVGKSLPAVLEKLAAGGAEDLSVLLDPATLEKIRGRFDARLAGELKKGFDFAPFPGLGAGFRVTERNGAAYYDFSAAAVAELFVKDLGDRLAAIVRDAVQGM